MCAHYGQFAEPLPLPCGACRHAHKNAGGSAGVFVTCSDFALLPHQKPHGVQQVLQIVGVQTVDQAQGALGHIDPGRPDARLPEEGLVQLPDRKSVV